jgi:ABC-2 type transport system permease protein
MVMRKILVVALREYNAAVRTKAFILSLVIMPVLMGGGILVQFLLKDYRDTREKRFAVIDRTPGKMLLKPLEKAVADFNEKVAIKDGVAVLPRYVLEDVPAPADNPEAVDALRLELSERVRKGNLAGVLEIGPEAAAIEEKSSSESERVHKGNLTGVLEIGPEATALEKQKNKERAGLRYQSNRITEQDFATMAQKVLGEYVRQKRIEAKGLPAEKVKSAVRPLDLHSKGLTVLASNGKTVEDAKESSRLASLFAPMLLMILMFMMVLMTATPLMQVVVEEKMQRIAEVLLGSVSPFSLMLGKIIGMTGVSLTIAAVYLGGAYFSAHHFGFSEHAPPGLIVWFLLFQTLASLMYGSLFIAVGAACTDMKETQNLLWPVMLLATMPMFVLGNVIREPNSGVVTVFSFFPFATPMLMIARQAVPPGVSVWQPFAGIAGVLATTLFCVWAAGRIFRVGILLQGKGANFTEMARWVFRG